MKTLDRSDGAEQVGEIGSEHLDGVSAGRTGEDLLIVNNGDGSDFLESGDGNDVLMGGLGNDVLLGSRGNDRRG
jgi:Ca2+-binding RTX toxin-like protein